MKTTKTGDKVLSVRLPKAIYKRVAEIADRETRSMNQQILHYVKQGLGIINGSDIQESYQAERTGPETPVQDTPLSSSG